MPSKYVPVYSREEASVVIRMREERLNQKFPHINYTEGEILNIDYHIKRLILKAWCMPEFKTVIDICNVIGIAERTFYRLKPGLTLPELPFRKSTSKKN